MISINPIKSHDEKLSPAYRKLFSILKNSFSIFNAINLNFFRLLKVTKKLKFIKIIIMIKVFNHYCRKITRGFVKTLIIKTRSKKR